MGKDQDEADVEIEDQEIDEDVDLDSDEEDEDQDEDVDEAEDSKPVTKKDLRDFAKNMFKSTKQEIDKRFINKRHQQKDPTKKPINRKPGDEGNGDSRLDDVVKNQQMSDFAEDNDLTKKEVKHLASILGRVPTKNDLKSPFIKGGLAAFRQENNVDGNIPTGAAARTFKVDGKSWDQMDSGEKKKNFAAHQQAILAGKK